MKKLTALLGLVCVMGCQSESLHIVSPYRIRLEPISEGTQLGVGRMHAFGLNLKTDSYYERAGYELVFYQASGLGRLYRDDEPIPQNMPVKLPMGVSGYSYIPEAAGPCQLVLIARQDRGYTEPDTIRLNFQVNP